VHNDPWKWFNQNYSNNKKNAEYPPSLPNGIESNLKPIPVLPLEAKVDRTFTAVTLTRWEDQIQFVGNYSVKHSERSTPGLTTRTHKLHEDLEGKQPRN